MSKRPLIDAPRALIAACFADAAASIHFNLLPSINQAWTDTVGLDEAQVGLLNAYSMGGFTLGILSAPFWVRRADWRRTILMGATAVAALSAIVPFLPTPLRRPGLFVCLGIAITVVQATVMTMLGDSTHRERAYGVMYAMEMALAIVLSLFLTTEAGSPWGIRGILLMIAGVTLLVVPVAAVLPARHLSPPSSPVGQSRWPSPLVLMTLAGIAVFTFGIVGTWSFLEHMAEAKLGGGSGSLLVTVALFASLCGSVVSSLLDDRWGRSIPLMLSIVGVAAGILTIDQSQGAALFYAGAVVTAFAWNFALTFATSLLARVDATGRFVPLALAAMGLGATGGTAFLGDLIVDRGYSQFLGVSAALAALGLVIILVGSLVSDRSR